MTELGILIVEDSQRDLDLIVHEFSRSGYSVHAERVETAKEMSTALLRHSWDVILSDNALPTFDANRALAVLQDSQLDIPFIIVSGMIGEERAVELMKAGASDYVSKKNLARLIPVVERAVRDAAERRERRRIELELEKLNFEQQRMLNQRSALLDINNAVIASLNRQSLCQAIFMAVRESLPCSAAVLTLRNAESGSLETVLAESATGTALERGQAALLDLGEELLSSRQVLALTLPSADRQFPREDFLLSAGVRSIIAAPLKTKAEPFGALTLMSALTGNPWRDMDFFAQVCHQVAFAVENMLSYEQIAALKSRLERENAYLIEEIKSEHNFEEMAGTSPAFLALIDKVRRVAPTDATVLITGESGTGKELVARAIHSRSLRGAKPLVKVNCAAISAGLVESELFGHVRGAFTGASERRIGRFEFAQGGTIFLDEVGELPLETQSKLLRVLQEHEFEPVGSNRTIAVDVRIIAATNRQLDQAVREGRFRADLYFRLNVVPIEVPPLRMRSADIPDLVSFILANYNRQFGRTIESVADETMQRLMSYQWPGNIRELQNLLARAVVLSSGPVLRLGDDLLPSISTPSNAESSRPASQVLLPQSANRELTQIERDHIRRVLDDARWVIEGPKGAATVLGLHPNTLRSRMKKLDIRRPN